MASKSRKNEYTDLEQEIDLESFTDSVLQFFNDVPDPRLGHNQTYKLEHVFFIILTAMLAGANSISQISVFSKSKAQWIKRFIPIEGIPTYGVFWWILVRMEPVFLRQLLSSWLAGVPEELRNQILAIDGKRLCGTQSDDRFKPSLHLVSLYAVHTGVILAQQPVDNKSNEITAIPKILEGIDIQGAIITSDAMGCQKDIAKKICMKGADYVLALKGNAGIIHDEVLNYFEQAKLVDYDGVAHTSFAKQDKGHGRVVLRTVRCVQELEWLPQIEEWENLKGIVEVVSERTEKGKTTTEHRYYITSKEATAEKLAMIIQSHWGIENHLHRQLDVNFAEDASPVNTGHAAENLAIFRRLALNILGPGKGLSDRRKRAAWEEDFLTEVVRKFFIKSF